MLCVLEAIGEQRIVLKEFFGNPRAHSCVEHVIEVTIAVTYESFTESLISSHELVTIVLRIAKDRLAVCSRLHVAGVLALHQMHQEHSHYS